MTHPSFLALDAYALEPTPNDVHRHVEGCAACAAHVATVRVQVPMPQGLMALGEQRPARPWWRWTLGAAVLATATAVTLLWVQPAVPETTAKGLPAAAVWVNRGGRVSSWDGQPLREGDAVRVEIVPAGFSHVTVFDEHAGRVLYEAQVVATTLTPAWQLDGAAGAEQLRVVLSQDAATPAQLEGPCTTSTTSWCSRITLERATP